MPCKYLSPIQIKWDPVWALHDLHRILVLMVTLHFENIPLWLFRVWVHGSGCEAYRPKQETHMLEPVSLETPKTFVNMILLKPTRDMNNT